MTRRATMASAGKKSAARRAAIALDSPWMPEIDYPALIRDLLREDRERVMMKRAILAFEKAIFLNGPKSILIRSAQEELCRLARRLTRRK